MMKKQYSSYEAILIYADHTRTSYSSISRGDPYIHFKNSNAVKMILFKAAHKMTRLEKIAEYSQQRE